MLRDNWDSTSLFCYGIFVTEEVMLAEEDKNAEEKSLDGAWYKRKHNNPGKVHSFTITYTK